MLKMQFPYPIKIVALFGVILLAACSNNSEDIPFQSGDSSYKQPSLQPLVFTAPKKITWDTTKKGGLHPVIKPFDINSLPTERYDSSDLVPFAQAPTQASFNFNKLRSKPFNLDSLPAKPLDFKAIVVGNPKRVRGGIAVPKQGSPLGISTLGAAQGIPGKVTTAVLKDKSGLMWVATDEGLFRYNGEEVEVFLSKLNTPIAGMVQDNDGNIWFVSSSGIRMLNPFTGMGYRSEKLWANVNSLAFMIKDDKGNIWISNLANKNIAVINPVNKTYATIDGKVGLSDSATAGVVEDEAKNIWVSTFKGFNIFNLHTNTLKYLARSDGLGADTLAIAASDSAGHIWVGARDVASVNSIKEINITAGIITSYTSPAMQHIYVTSLMVSAKNRIWMGASNGVMIIDPKQKTSKLITTKYGLSASFAITLAQDNSGRVWAGTVKGLNIIEQEGDIVYPLDNAAINTMLEGPNEDIWVGTSNGVKIIDTHKKLIRHFNTQHGLSHNLVQGFVVIDGNMWITSDGGLDIVNQTNKTIEHYGKAEGLANDTVYSILKTTTGDIWFTAPSAGIDVIDSKKTFIAHLGISSGLSNDDVAFATEDRQGLIWLATRLGGIDVIDMANQTIKYLNNVPGLIGLSNNILLYDNEGRMWIGTYKGIYVADTKTNTLTTITTAEGLPENKITSLLECNGKIYAATNKNVTIITPPGTATKGRWVVEQLANTETLSKEVPGTWATNAITTKGQYLWGDSGVTIINTLAGYTYTNPTYITGVQINNEQGDFLILDKKNLPDSIAWQDSFRAKNVVVDLPFYKKDGFEWDSVSGPYNLPANLHIAYNKNYLQFQYLQPSTVGTTAPVYRYILIGIDKQWSKETTNTFTENYLNLPPGTYTFKVASKGYNDKWGQPAAFVFTITPPWWKTWWAYTVYILLVTFAIWQFIRYRSRKLVSENQLLEEKVKQRTDALQRSLEDLKITQTQLVQSEKMASLGELTAGIAHEIQNPLNFVNNFSEVSIELVDELKEELDKTTLDNGTKDNINTLLDDLTQNQQKINFHGKRADSIVKGMLQHSRTGSGHKELTDLNALADEYLRLSYHGLRAKDKSFNAKLETNFEENLPKINMLMQDMGRVLINLYNNAFYSVMKKKATAGDGYQPIVAVSTRKIGNQVEIRVRDNGMGIPQSVLDKIYNPFFTTKPTGEGTGLGLSLSYEIVTKGHGGSIVVETKEGEFAEFIIRLPIL